MLENYDVDWERFIEDEIERDYQDLLLGKYKDEFYAQIVKERYENYEKRKTITS